MCLLLFKLRIWDCYRMPTRYIFLFLLWLGAAISQYADEPIQAESVGFRLDSVAQDTNSGLIVITATARVLADTAAYVYFPKAAGSITNLATNACASSTDICCLSSFDSQYSVSGNFDEVKDAYCPEGTLDWGVHATSKAAFNAQLQATDTAWSNAADIALNTVASSDSEGVGEPSVTLNADGTYTLVYKFAHSIIKDNLAIETTSAANAAEKTYRSMVGVLFIRTSDTSQSVTIHAAQAEFEYTKTTGLFVSVATEQQRLALDDITFTFHNAIDSSSNAHSFVQVTVDYDTSVFASYEIMATTLRYGAGLSYGAVSSWTTPVCPATAPTWDGSCSEPWTYCDYTAATSQFPFTGLAAMAGQNVYLQFTVRSTLVGGANTVLSHILVEMAVDSITPLESCQSTTFEPQDISDLVSVSATIGAGTNPLILNSIGTDAVNNVQVLTSSGESYSDALQLIELDAQSFLAKDYATGYNVVIDDGLVYNFLDTWGGTSNSGNTGYASVYNAIVANDGFTVTEANGRFTMTPVVGKATADTCANLADIVATTATFSNNCVYRRAIKDDSVQSNSVDSVHVVHSKDVTTTFADLKTASAQPWLKQNVYGNGDDAATTAFAAGYLSQHCTNGDGDEPTNGYVCIWVDPGFKWLSAPLNLANNPYTIADRTITVLLVSIRDSNNNAVARRLLSFDSADAMKHARRALERKQTLEAIKTAMVSSSMSIKHALPKRRTIKPADVAPSRHLLQSGSEEEEYMEDLPSHFAGSGLAVENSNVNAYVNTAVLTGHFGKKWQFFRVTVPMGAATKATLAHNFEAVGQAALGKPGLLGGSLKMVDFLFSDTMNGRQLLQANEMTATAILGTTAYAESLVLYKEYLVCLFDELRDVTTAYTTDAAKQQIRNCDGNLTDYKNKLGVTLEITSNCGAGTQKLTEECNRVLALEYFEYPRVDFDPTLDTTSVQPVLQFELETAAIITAATAQDEALLYNIRWSFAEQLGVNMDRVLVEVKSREATTSRRLLALEYYVWVTVFGDDRGGQVWPPEGSTATAIYTAKKAAATTEIASRSSIEFTAGDTMTTPVAPPSPSSFPFRLQLSGLFPTTRTQLIETDLINIGQSVNSLIPSLLGVPMTDVLVHNVRKVSMQILFEVSVKALTADAGCKLRATADENVNAMQSSMTSRLKTLGYLTGTQAVTFPTVEIKDSNNKNIDCTNYTLTVVLIIVAVVLLGGGALYMYFRPVTGEAGTKVGGATTEVPAAVKPVVKPQVIPGEQAGGAQSRIAGNVIYTRIL